MTEQRPMTPARLERRAQMMKRVNVPMRFVLGLPFRTPLSSRLMLLSYTGRPRCVAVRVVRSLAPKLNMFFRS